MSVFGAVYADAYDEIYRDKDYPGECDLMERVFRVHATGPLSRVLDLGCGTGGHAALLAERGYDVVGVDRSPEMLERARARGGTARFQVGDIARVDIGETFDAALIMFAVLGYLTQTVDVQAALCTARRHLRTGGLLFFDVWYGPAVLTQRPSERVKVIDTAEGDRLIRAASSELDARRDVCTVSYRLWRLRGSQLLGEAAERHAMRYFFEPELEAMLRFAGFEVTRISGFPDMETEPSERTWNVAVVARAV